MTMRSLTAVVVRLIILLRLLVHGFDLTATFCGVIQLKKAGFLLDAVVALI